MNFIERLGQQPRRWLLLEAIAFVAAIGVVDLLTTWQFSMFIFYCLPVYIVALYFPRRVALLFVFGSAVMAAIGDLDSIAVRGLGSYCWSGMNRTCGFLLAAMCGISFGRYREETQRRIAALQRSQELEREVVRAGEMERKKIGQELHDGVCQTLAALDCAAQCLKMDLESDRSPLSNMAAQIQKQLSGATLEARTMARGIYPIALSAEGFPCALQELAASMSQLFGGTIKVQCEPDFEVPDSEVAMHLYRITQEALSNALRHANATQIEVLARKHGDQLSLTIADDGCGSALQERPNGMGSHTMRYRANLIGAQFIVDSRPGEGTRIRCEMPAVGLAA